jgi:hypothetical protein
MHPRPVAYPASRCNDDNEQLAGAAAPRTPPVEESRPTPAAPEYDLFISYAEPDRAWVEGYLLDGLGKAKGAFRPRREMAERRAQAGLLRCVSGNPAGGAGAAWWAPNLFNVSSVAQSQGINFQAQYVLGDRLRRIDYDLPDGTWSLDSVEMLPQMIRIGHERSAENLAALLPILFAQPAQHPYQPFPNVPPVAPPAGGEGGSVVNNWDSGSEVIFIYK